MAKSFILDEPFYLEIDYFGYRFLPTTIDGLSDYRMIVNELKFRTIYVAIYIFSLTAHVILDQQFLISNKGLAISCSNVSK